MEAPINLFVNSLAPATGEVRIASNDSARGLRSNSAPQSSGGGERFKRVQCGGDQGFYPQTCRNIKGMVFQGRNTEHYSLPK